MTNLYKILFTVTTMAGSMISISSYSWMGMWMGLEINLLSIIPLFSSSKNLMSSESALKYFITQALASMMFLFSMILMMYLNKFNTNFLYTIWPSLMMNSALLTKMGAAPFHFWFPEVAEGLDWLNCFILLTWQKIAPMVLMMFNMNMTTFFTIIIIMCMMISSLMALNQTSMRKILVYSSINHMGWMISSMMFMETIWLYYLTIYIFTTMSLILILNLYNIQQFSQIFPSMENNPFMKLLFMMTFFSLGGIPPFLGFFPKWLIIQLLIQNKFIMLPMMMILMTLIMLYIYIRLTFTTLVINTNKLNYNKKAIQFNKFMIMLLNSLLIMSLMMCTILFNWI